jgi:phage-related baseplate assembly protein
MPVIDLTHLPPPSIVETLDFEALLATLKADLTTRAPALAPVLALESEPLVKLLEVAAWREMELRARVNAAMRAQLLAFANGSDLDHLGAFYGVERLAGETDDGLRQRIQARIAGWANAGGAAHYRYWALSADARVQDVGVVSPAPGVVRVTVLVRDGAPKQEVIAAVRAQVLRDDVRVLTDTVEVVDAQMLQVTVQARLWLLPGALPSLVDEIAARLAQTIRSRTRLGWDMTRSWLIAELHWPQVHHVELDSPLQDVRCAPHQAVQLTGVTLQMMGYDQ